jgi:hypothetical protein
MRDQTCFFERLQELSSHHVRVRILLKKVAPPLAVALGETNGRSVLVSFREALLIAVERVTHATCERVGVT